MVWQRVCTLPEITLLPSIGRMSPKFTVPTGFPDSILSDSIPSPCQAVHQPETDMQSPTSIDVFSQEDE